ncbi:MAG: family 43 glycosylhydrolase [Sphingobacteriaceae bacterium]|nr:family 43 glycosylhydrolase [Sphingobacteriaceae bacterium]
MIKNESSRNVELNFASRTGLSRSFKIKIIQAGGQPECLFEITAENSFTGRKTCSIKLPKREHQSYLDLYVKLSETYGFRVPQNRNTTLNTPSNFKIEYKEVLTTNISQEILYGYGDPALTRVDRSGETFFYLLATSNDAPQSFPILRSKNLSDWELVNFVFPHGNKPEWAAEGEHISDYWAAEMHQVGEEFRVYFVAREKVGSELCIGMAKSSNPEGPFIAEKFPIIRGNVIDPHIFVESEKTVFLYWKEDNNDVWPGKLIELLHHNPQYITTLFETREDQATAEFIQTIWPWIKTLPPMERFLALQIIIEAIIANFRRFYNKLRVLLTVAPSELRSEIEQVLRYMKTPMYVQPLSKDGSQLVLEKTKILENDLEWEAHLVEGMWVTHHNSNYYLFYAGNDFSTDQYGIGVAVGKSPVGPFTKNQSPFLQSTSEWRAPGHPSVVTDLNGNPQMFLHAYFPEKAGYKEFRALLSVPLIFFGDNVSAR